VGHGFCFENIAKNCKQEKLTFNLGAFMKITQNVYWFATAIGYICAVVLLGACGASMPSKPIHGKAAGQWFVQLPTTPSPYASMAYGRDGAGVGAKVAQNPPQLDAYLKPEYRGRAYAPKTPRVTAPAPVPAAKTAAPEPVRDAQVVARAEPVSVAAPPAVSDVERYAQRDATSQKQQNFKAGDVLVIGLGGILLIVLIVVLLIVLLRH
jgi:hypothetical protein